jgi:tetratricopeptide (TPR) repeat protein
MKQKAKTSGATPAAEPQNYWPAALIVVAVIAAYANSLKTPFLFDDFFAIHDNPTIRQLWPPSVPLSPPVNGSGVVGRPLVNLSLALNHAVGGLDVRGYHAANVAIHALAALALFGVVRRTLRLPALRDRLGGGATGFALAAALGWALHPLQTESVTFVIQRTESLMGLLFLTALYGFIRAAESPGKPVWARLTYVALLAGMAAKEVMVVAPVVLFLYDRTFVAGTFSAAWRERGRLHLGLATAWILLVFLVVGSGGSRGGTSGFGAEVLPWQYLLTQAEAIVLYARLALWPAPLVVDYGTGLAQGLGGVVVPGLLVLAGLGLTVWALWRRPVWGFLGAWFFVILAPSSSVVPLATQTIAEHRMYLPLAAVVVALALAVRRFAGGSAGAVAAAVLMVYGGLTIARNRDYRSAVTIWQDTVEHRPDNGRAHHNLAQALYNEGRLPDAVPPLERAIALEPTAESHGLMGTILAALGRPAEALEQSRRSIQMNPGNADARASAAYILGGMGRLDEALAEMQEAVRLAPVSAGLRMDLGLLQARLGRLPEAAESFANAIRIDPANAAAHSNLGSVHLQAGHLEEAARSYEEAVRLDPDYAEAYLNLAMTRADQGRTADAVRHAQRALQIQPGLQPARELLDQLQRTGAPAR